ncbi:MAG: hypothetical protein Fur006_49350 [Coleofasciculaceae cyanobacterium]
MQKDFAGNTLGTARSLDITSNLQTFTDSLSPLNLIDYYSFTLGSKSSFNLSLSGFSADADMELLNSKGEVLLTSAKPGTELESLLATLNAGSYYIKVYSGAETSTNYNLSLSATSLQNSDTFTGFGNPSFDTGVFTVGNSGQVSIDYLFDGGIYEGELAIFSLEGMEQYQTDLNQFIAEAARRALSDSHFGHVVISDATEGARFHGSFPWEPDWNSGDYLGVNTFSMRPGDTFGVMLIPNGTVQQVSENPCVEGAIRPLFSLSTANPNDAFHLGQIADVNGKGNTFTMEDLRVDGCSDKDYNDIIFQVRGATGKAVKLDDVIDLTQDWRSIDLGKNLMKFIKPSENQPLIGVIDTGLNGSNPDINSFHVHLGHDYVAGDGNPLLQAGEGSEHGTHITGIIAATQDNGIGINGINDQAPIYVTRAIGSGQWAQALTEIVDAAKESGQPNAIANLSLDLTQVNADGSVTTRYEFTPEERAALEYARQNHVLIVAAAGNDGGVMSVLGQASREFDNIITVGAAQAIDVSSISQPSGTISQAFNRVNYSSYGYGLDIVAPGGTIDNPVLSTVGDGVGTMAGTSVATAQVTGAASLAWAENPDLSYRQVIDILKSTAIDLETVGWDPQTGEGLLDTEAAVNLAKTTTPESYTPEPFSTPTTWGGEGEVLPTERAVWTTAEIGQKPTGGSYASGYIPPWQSSATLTQDWNSSFSHVDNSAYAKDWVIADRKVYAAKAGTVVSVKQDSTTYGDNPAYANDANYVIIRHDDGYESIYFHLEAGSVPISVGDYVEAGTYLGMTGLSGWTTGEHLHFAVRNPNTRSSVPFLFDGTPVTGNQPIQTPNSSEVWLTEFDGWTMATIGANVRSGPGTNYQDLDTLPYGTPLEFDAWTYGETITDIALGTPDARWYRIKGTNDWISSAIVNGNAPGSTPLPSTNLNSPNGFTVGGNFYTVWQQYLGTLGNPISGVSSHSSGASYQLFDNGSIVSSQYGTFPLYGAIRQTYLDTGGLNGWLGVPTSAAVSQGNGVIKQTFEHGYIIWNGSRATAYQTGIGTPVTLSPDNKPRLRVEHTDYEKLVWAVYDYGTDKQAAAEEVFRSLGYKVDQDNGGVFDDKQTGLYALGLTSDTKPPVFVIRGTGDILDAFDDTNPASIGYGQFANNQSGISSWLENVKTRTGYEPDVIGHSLGGALAQLVTANFTDKVGQTITFNAPGVSYSTVQTFQANGGKPEKDVTHYIVSGDVVSMAGWSYLPGTVNFVDYLDTNIVDAINPFSEHLIGANSTKEPGYSLIDENRSDGEPFATVDKEFSVNWLSNPLFFYVDPDYFTFLLTVAEIVPVVGQQIALALLTRASTETSRNLIGSGLRLLLAKLGEARQWAEGVGNVAKELGEATLKTALNLMLKYGVKALRAISKVIKYGKTTLETAFSLLEKLGEGVLEVMDEVAKFGKAMLDTALELLTNAGQLGGAVLNAIINAAKVSQQALEATFNFWKLIIG